MKWIYHCPATFDKICDLNDVKSIEARSLVFSWAQPFKVIEVPALHFPCPGIADFWQSDSRQQSMIPPVVEYPQTKPFDEIHLLEHPLGHVLSTALLHEYQKVHPDGSLQSEQQSAVH